jgi:hypothetical protein
MRLLGVALNEGRDDNTGMVSRLTNDQLYPFTSYMDLTLTINSSASTVHACHSECVASRPNVFFSRCKLTHSAQPSAFSPLTSTARFIVVT